MHKDQDVDQCELCNEKASKGLKRLPVGISILETAAAGVHGAWEPSALLSGHAVLSMIRLPTKCVGKAVKGLGKASAFANYMQAIFCNQLLCYCSQLLCYC
jgi:hypothetical protein